MATISQLITARATAGARYLAAVDELRDAAVDLAGYDEALANANMPTPGPERPGALVFVKAPDDLRVALEHREYVPRVTGGGGSLDSEWLPAINTRAKQLIASLSEA